MDGFAKTVPHRRRLNVPQDIKKPSLKLQLWDKFANLAVLLANIVHIKIKSKPTCHCFDFWRRAQHSNTYLTRNYSGVVMANFVRRAACNFLNIGSRNFSVSAPRHAKVSVLGAAGGIGQPLSLLLKQVCRICITLMIRFPFTFAMLHSLPSINTTDCSSLVYTLT